MSEDLKNYFSYMSDVLGIKHLMVDQSGQQKDVKLSQPILVSVEDFIDYSTEEKDLLNKMLSALKIDLALFKTIDSSEKLNQIFEFEIYFTDKLSNQEVSENKIITYSPRTLLTEPAFKKEAWESLKKVINFYS